MQYKLHAQLHEKYVWINDGVRGKKSIGSFQGTSTVALTASYLARFSLFNKTCSGSKVFIQFSYTFWRRKGSSELCFSIPRTE
jgi:hypothetical protein